MDAISIVTIPAAAQRYNTAGDWQQTKNGMLIITTSRTGYWQYDLLLQTHEMVEATLCLEDGVTQEMVDEFDLQYKGDGEPGDELNCPYHKQHQIATAVEQHLAGMMGVNWKQYEHVLEEMHHGYETTAKRQSKGNSGGGNEPKGC